MKVLLLLPFVLAASSCIYPEPYTQQRSPYHPGGRAYPYGPRGQQMPPGPDAYGETGRYERLDDGSGPGPGPQGDSRPPAPRIDDDFQPEGNTPPPQPQPKPRKEYPLAKPGNKPGEVISPYPPYKTLEIENIKSGALAKDPQTGEIFRVP